MLKINLNLKRKEQPLLSPKKELPEPKAVDAGNKHIQLGLEAGAGAAKAGAVKIILLTNSVYYFIQFVFIILQPDGFRLVALHNNQVLWDKTYPTLRGAKIAFTKVFRQKAWIENLKGQWSVPYDPDNDWLEDKLKPLQAC